MCQTTALAGLINVPLSAVAYSCVQRQDLSQERATAIRLKETFLRCYLLAY